MAPMSRGSNPRASSVSHAKTMRKSGTPTTRKHRFETFSQRIAKFNVDPVRRAHGRTHAFQQDDASHFASAFQEWKDLNMSENFSSFVRQTEPLCHSLPQILHYEQQIFESLLASIEKGDTLSLEPLLNLVVHLAHDLGVRFEAHFGPVVSAVSALASQHSNVEVIEWSFTCLAWLFKYLSRLLVPNLRPLFDLLAPLLGKTYQKEFVTKFAAESLSFLIRKAAAAYSRDPMPLRIIVRHAFSDLSNVSCDRASQYQQGLSALLAEAMKGIQKGTHSQCRTIFTVILWYLLHEFIDGIARERSRCVIESALEDVLFHTDSDGCVPLIEAYVDATATPMMRRDSRTIGDAARLMLLFIGAQEGRKITKWSVIWTRLLEYMGTVQSVAESLPSEMITSLLRAVAVAIQYTPHEHLLQVAPRITQELEVPAWDSSFLSFCNFASGIGEQRFQEFILPSLLRFIALRWDQYETQLCFLLPQLYDRGALGSSIVHIPDSSQVRIAKMFEDFAKSQLDLSSMAGSGIHGASASLALCNDYLDMLVRFPHPNIHNTILKTLANVLEAVSKPDTIQRKNSSWTVFVITNGLRYLVEYSSLEDLRSRIWPAVLLIAQQHLQRARFLQAFLRLLQRLDMSSLIESPAIETIRTELVENLASASHDLRILSIEILLAMHGVAICRESEAFCLMLDLERGHFDLDTARSISVMVRRLAAIFQESSVNNFTRHALIGYFFGMLHIRLASVWDDACSALQTISTVKAYGDVIVDRALSWLSGYSDHANQGVEIMTTSQLVPQLHRDNNLSRLESIVARTEIDVVEAQRRSRERLFIDSSILTRFSATHRSQGLRVLQAIPALAERRSRALVPVLLQWMSTESGPASYDDVSTSTVPEAGGDRLNDNEQSMQRWNRGDHKALVQLFTSFNNPSALYQSNEVYKTFLNLLCHGDVEIQRLAVHAILSWNQDSLTTHKEHLLNLLDDARFRDELAIFLNVDEANSEIRMDHREILIPVVLRVLYGRVISQTGSKSARGSQKSKRRAVLTSIARLGDKELRAFLNIALGPLSGLWQMDEFGVQRCFVERELMSPRKQLGMLRLLVDTVETLSSRLQPVANCLVNAILYCLVRACRQLQALTQTCSDGLGANPGETMVLKSCRQEGMSCLVALFDSTGFDWMDYAATIMTEIVNPRLAKLSIESAQSVSGLLRLLSTWSKSRSTIYMLVSINNNLLQHVADCLIEPSAREDVKLFALKHVICNVLNMLPANSEILSYQDPVYNSVDVAMRNGLGQTLLDRISRFLRSSHVREVLEICVDTLPRLASYAIDSSSIKDILQTSLDVLSQPARIASPRIKGQILLILLTFIPRFDYSGDSILSDRMLCILSSLFNYFKDISNRQSLVLTFLAFAEHDTRLVEVARLCEQLNALDQSKLNQPDFELRLNALRVISDERCADFGALQWLPLVNNMLFLMRDDEDLAMRTSASLCLRRFVQQACIESDAAGPLSDILSQTLVPALHRGMSEASELIRGEFVSILAEMVTLSWTPVADMACLHGPDDESSFFKNILHIQRHRRIRALRRLSSDADSLSSENIARFCLPLVEKFLEDGEEGDYNLGTEVLSTLEALSGGLEWQRYRSLLQQATINAAKMNSKLRIRTLNAIANGLHGAWRSTTTQPVVNQDESATSRTHRNLARTLPDGNALSKSLVQPVFSKLADVLHFKDDSTVDMRVLLAPVTVKIISVLPNEFIQANLPPLLMDICSILRSKAQEARDAARKALADIAGLIGSGYFGFIIKQLRTALQRGSQLHVLSFTVHSILVSSAPSFKCGDIDYCLPDLMEVFMNDTFGATGVEKESQDYVSRMKEVKKRSLSFDSLEIVASITSLSHVMTLLRPLEEQLCRHRPKVSQVDEMLRRIREGLRQNTSIRSHDSLTLSYEILHHSYQNVAEGNGQSKLCSWKTASFAMDLLRKVLDKYEEHKTPENLVGFLPMLQFSLEQEDEDVQIAALRVMTSIIKLPLKDLDENAKFYIHRVKSIIDASASTNTPIAQTGMRFISAILRDRPNAKISKSVFDSHISYLVRRIKPDLQSPGRQGERDQQVAAFNFLRAVLGRKQPFAEIYDVMDVVREVMISNTEPPIPDLARSVYSRFVLDYFPEEMKGLSKQLDFLVANLQYPQSRGRLSVMELAIFLITHKSDTAVQPILVTFFLPLVVSLATESDEQCRDSTKILLRKIFERAGKEQLKSFKVQMSRWLNDVKDPLWQQAALQCWTINIDVHSSTSEAITIRNHAERVLNTAIKVPAQGNARLLSTVLEFLQKLTECLPAVAFAADSTKCWAAVVPYSANELQGIRATATTLLGSYLVDFIKTAAKGEEKHGFPIKGSAGLELDCTQALTILETGMRSLRTEKDDSIMEQATNNVALIGRLCSDADGSDEVLTQIFKQAAAVVRMEGPPGPPKAKVACVKILLLLTKTTPPEYIEASLQDILLPLQNIVDIAIPAAATYNSEFQRVQEELLSHVQELLAALQIKMGSSTYISSMQAVQKVVRGRREERRSKRRIDSISAPEKTDKKRLKKQEAKKVKRREKNTLAAGRRRGW